MRHLVIWSDEAAADLDELFLQILQDSPQGALLVDDRINDQVELLGGFPYLGKVGRLTGTRELVVNATSYVIVYTVDDEAVRLLRIVHGARDRSGGI